MERQKKVVDASIILRWFLNEDKSDKVRKLIKKHLNEELIIIVPELIFLEILNALRFKNYNNKLFDVNRTLQNAQFYVVNTDESIINKTIAISLEYNLTIYDAVYAALSQIYGCELITEDKELKKFPNAVAL